MNSEQNSNRITLTLSLFKCVCLTTGKLRKDPLVFESSWHLLNLKSKHRRQIRQQPGLSSI